MKKKKWVVNGPPEKPGKNEATPIWNKISRSGTEKDETISGFSGMICQMYFSKRFKNALRRPTLFETNFKQSFFMAEFENKPVILCFLKYLFLITIR